MNERLNDLNTGESARVEKLLMKGSMRRRLLDLGMIEGTKIIALQKSRKGDMTAYWIRGAVIALRCEDAFNILIR